MKEKTSVTLSREVLAGVDRLARSKHSRSAVIERILRRFLRDRARANRQARDLERINRSAEQAQSGGRRRPEVPLKTDLSEAM